MPYKGPGFYNEHGRRICSFHPEAMQEFIDSQGFAHIQNAKEYEYLEEDIVEQTRQDVKNGLYGALYDTTKWGGTD